MFVFDRTTTGYNKLLKGKPSEDALMSCIHDDYIVMAVADGHGASSCRYAARGAECAVQCMTKTLDEARDSVENVDAFGVYLNDNSESIMKTFVRRWVNAVVCDYFAYHAEEDGNSNYEQPLKDFVTTIYEDVKDQILDVETLRKKSRMRYNLENATYKITHLYGTTINAVVVTDKFVFAIGLGDGDVIVVNKKRVEWLLDMPTQYDTTPASLCNNFEDILYKYKHSISYINSGKRVLDSYFKPAIVMVMSDGLRNSYNSNEAYIEQMLSIAQRFRHGEGHRVVRESQEWIAQRSMMRGGDDISFCLCSRYDKDTGKELRVNNNK